MSEHDPEIVARAAKAVWENFFVSADVAERFAREVLDAVADDLRDHCHLALIAALRDEQQAREQVVDALNREIRGHGRAIARAEQAEARAERFKARQSEAAQEAQKKAEQYEQQWRENAVLQARAEQAEEDARIERLSSAAHARMADDLAGQLEQAERERADLRAAVKDACHHCGSGPDSDGDHSCPCPSADSECLEHTLHPVMPEALLALLAEADADNGGGEGQ